MKEYKRMTKYMYGAPTASCDNCEYEFGDGVSCTPYNCYNALTTRLAELEDKIENGTLIDMPRIIHPNKAEWYVQYQYPSGVIQYYICFSEADAEKMLAELKGE